MELPSNAYDIRERWCDELAATPQHIGIDPATGKYVYEGDDCWLLCMMEDKPSPDDEDIPF
jgi:hypothetical protein